MIKLTATLFIVIVLFGCGQQPPENRMSHLTGMYKLLISENEDSNGIWHEDPWTKGGEAYIIYDGLGHMAAHVTPAGFNDFEWLSEAESVQPALVNSHVDSMSAPELREALKHFAASYLYFANCSVEDSVDVVRHDRLSSSIPAIVGTSVRREFSFNGDTLTLRILNGNRRLKWLRME